MLRLRDIRTVLERHQANYYTQYNETLHCTEFRVLLRTKDTFVLRYYEKREKDYIVRWTTVTHDKLARKIDQFTCIGNQWKFRYCDPETKVINQYSIHG